MKENNNQRQYPRLLGLNETRHSKQVVHSQSNVYADLCDFVYPPPTAFICDKHFPNRGGPFFTQGYSPLQFSGSVFAETSPDSTHLSYMASIYASPHCIHSAVKGFP